MIKQLFSNKIVFIATATLGLLYLIIIFAPFFAPYNYDNENVLYAYSPPTNIHLFSVKNKIFRPFVYGKTYQVNEFYQRVYQEDKTKIYPLKFFVSGERYKLFGFWETNIHLFGVENGKIFIFGADWKGRDLFSRIIFGGQISLSIGILGAGISLFLGLFIGAISGYFGGRVDTLLMRLCEMIMMVPSFYLMLALRAAFPPSLSSAQIYLLIIVILSFIGWASTARVIRGIAISLRQREFILASKSLGMSNLSIVVCHVIPHTLSYALVAFVLRVPAYILGEAALSLLGLGIQDPQASWGNLLSQALGIVDIRLFPWILIPGVFIIITVVCFNVIGEWLRDVLDPKRRII